MTAKITSPPKDLLPTAPLDALFSFIENRRNLEKGRPLGDPHRLYRLDRMKLLCAAFANPQETYPVVHLAGSKGKSSTAAYLAALLQASGRRVGVYSSPHVVNYRERFRIEKEPFPEKLLYRVAQQMLEKIPTVEEKFPSEGQSSTFELLTLLAFLFFREAKCDTVVLETGLGGRLDATNVVPSPEVVVITPIEKEHSDVLGKRLTSIAREKAGILKPSTPVFIAEQMPAVHRVFLRQARALGVPLFTLKQFLKKIDPAPNNPAFPLSSSWEIHWKDTCVEKINLAMGGHIQAENAALALLVSRFLEPKLTLSSPLVPQTLSTVQLPGRSQLLRHSPPLMIDAAHTPRSITALRETFRPLAGSKPLLLFACVEGKNHSEMARILVAGKKGLFSEVIVSKPGHFRSSNPPAVAKAFRWFGVSVQLIEDLSTAWETVLQKAGKTRSILVTGSFHMLGEIAALGLPHPPE